MKYKYLIEAETWTGKWAGFLCKYEINVNVSAAMLSDVSDGCLSILNGLLNNSF